MPTNDKLAAAAHLVIARLPPDCLGATKLNKVLWFSDCEHYRRHGRSLTGEVDYIRRPNGPCPIGMSTTITKLKAAGAIAESLKPVADFSRREFTALKEPNIDAFSAEEIDILLSVALELAPRTAADVSEASHDALWLATPAGERMSVEAGSVRIEAPTPDVIDWARVAFAAE